MSTEDSLAIASSGVLHAKLPTGRFSTSITVMSGNGEACGMRCLVSYDMPLADKDERLTLQELFSQHEGV
ncbi:hypothetical protein MMC08_005226 [Hypocenomyce scalaris]|nr:hypothetical protein [Hypocenomyce scalaris]